MGETPWMDWLRKHFGIVEKTGALPTDFIKEIFSHTGFGNVGNSTPPSCAATISAALEEVGLKSTHDASAISYAHFGQACELKPGCIVVFQWSDGGHHVTCCDHIVDANHVACLGGNQSSQIKISVFPRSAIIATRWPLIPAVKGLDYDKAVAYVIENEGTTYENVPGDGGGPTRFGITQDDLATYFRRSVTPEDVQGLDYEAASKILKALYWAQMGCDQMNSQAKATALFDQGLLLGIRTASKLAQKSAFDWSINGKSTPLTVDGIIGPKSVAAINLLDDRTFLHNLNFQATDRYKGIVVANPSQKKFLQGWLNRANRLLTLV